MRNLDGCSWSEPAPGTAGLFPGGEPERARRQSKSSSWASCLRGPFTQLITRMELKAEGRRPKKGIDRTIQLQTARRELYVTAGQRHGHGRSRGHSMAHIGILGRTFAATWLV